MKWEFLHIFISILRLKIRTHNCQAETTNKNKFDNFWHYILIFNKLSPYNIPSNRYQHAYFCWNWKPMENLRRITYLPFSKVTVNSLCEQLSSLLEVEALLEGHLLTIKAGCFGVGRVLDSLPSMNTTFDMVGRSFGSSCTHNSPTFTHFKYSSVVHVWHSVWSINSSALSTFHKCHAWKSIIHWNVLLY